MSPPRYRNASKVDHALFRPRQALHSIIPTPCTVGDDEDSAIKSWLPKIEALSHFGHWRWNVGDAGPRVSAELCRILGQPPGWQPTIDEVLGLIATVDRYRVADLFRAAIENRRSEIAFDCLARASARLVHLQTRVCLHWGEDGSGLRLLGVSQDVSEITNLRSRIRKLMVQDVVTSLPNRELFYDRLGSAMAEAECDGRNFGLLQLDLDRFKDVNDTLGHGVGDRLLRETAGRLQALAGDHDTVARLGGDEFAIIVTDVRDVADMGVIAGNILDALAHPFRTRDRDLFLSASIGIAMFPADGRSAGDLLRNAELALYDAKNHGRATYRYYVPELAERSRERDALLADLRQAEPAGELEIYFQPKIDLNNRTLVGAEALLRWHHPNHGLLGPNKFIGLAEESGLIDGIGRWVLTNACHAARQWNASSGRNLKIAVNLSSRQFALDDLTTTVRNVLARTGCQPNWLELEITESLLLNDDNQVRQTLLAFREMGISVAIDDFGTGYSGLSYLKRFPIDVLKIDQSFIHDIAIDGDSTALVVGILQIAQSLRMTTVAEGIETDLQRDFLSSHGCHLGQGYLFGKPMPMDDFELLL